MSKCVKCGNEILTGDIHWEMGLCNNCYNELYKDHKTHISLDKMWLNLAQSFRDENEKLQEKITDLETKLAECESELEKQKEKYDKLYGCYKKTSSEDLQDKYSLAEENEQLKKQLTEKEKEYQSFKKIADENVNYLKNRILEETKKLQPRQNLLRNRAVGESERRNGFKT